MKSINQWINLQGKIPFSHATGQKINAHDPANWLTYETAKSNANGGHVGFVLTENDPYFCVDIDNAKIDAGWSDHAIRIMSWFPGAYVEISTSGTGLHIIGRYTGPAPPHRKKITFGTDEVELYTEERMIVITENSNGCDYNLDLTGDLHKFIQAVMPPTTTSTTPGSYDSPDPDWLGPDDDDELITRMLASKKSVSSHLNGKAGIHDLWTANSEALTASYPDPTRTYDASSADAALFAHLAFWTGKHLPRMIRLAKKSALVRDKWIIHKNYLGMTGSGACERCTAVYRDPSRVTVEPQDANGIVTGSRFLDITAQIKYFKGHAFIISQNAMYTPNNKILEPGTFTNTYGGYTFALTHDAKSTTKKAFDAFTQSQGYDFPKVAGTCFKPQRKSGEIIIIEGKTYVNTYVPPLIKIENGPVDKYYLFHINKLFPDKIDRAIIMAYSAACLQHKGTKFKWCPVIQGVEGNGKSTIMDCIAYALGEDYTHITQNTDFNGVFNDWLDRKLFVMVDEISTIHKREVADILKPLITNKRIAIQGKGKKVFMSNNVANFWMSTNHKNALPKTDKDRRYAIFFTPQQEKSDLDRDGLTPGFFKDMHAWLNSGGYADVAGYLMRYKIPDELNPATSCLRAPDTTSTVEAVQASRPPVYDDIQEAIDLGLNGFRNGWISSWALSKLLDDKRVARFLPFRKRGEALRTLGYIPAPWFPQGRSSIKIPNENGSQPILYILANMQYGSALTTNDYINAQSD